AEFGGGGADPGVRRGGDGSRCARDAAANQRAVTIDLDDRNARLLPRFSNRPGQTCVHRKARDVRITFGKWHKALTSSRRFRKAPLRKGGRRRPTSRSAPSSADTSTNRSSSSPRSGR